MCLKACASKHIPQGKSSLFSLTALDCSAQVLLAVAITPLLRLSSIEEPTIARPYLARREVHGS